MKKGNKTQAHAGWPAIQRPRHEQHRPAGRLYSDRSLKLPLYVEIAIKNQLPPGWKPTGLAERCKIKVQFGEKWWELPKVHAECVFGQLIYQETTTAYYAWCWGKTRNGSWQPCGSDMRTNINRYTIDVEHLVQVNIDNGRKRKSN